MPGTKKTKTTKTRGRKKTAKKATAKGPRGRKPKTVAEEPLSAQSKDVIIEIECHGISPLLMHAMSKEMIISALIRGEKSQIKKDEPLVNKAERGMYRDDKGTVIIPATNLFASLREAGRKVEYDGRTKISTAKSTLLPSILSIREFNLELINLKTNKKMPEGWVVDVRKGVLPNNGIAVGIVRPRFDSWGFKLTLDVTLEPPITEKTLKKLFRIAGNAIGLCSFRPEKKGPFGRFKVVKWKMTEVKD